MDDTTDLEDLTVEQLIELLRERTGAGVNLSFPGKLLARRIGRKVRPRTSDVRCNNCVHCDAESNHPR